MEAFWRFSVFLGMLILMLSIETWRPCCVLSQPRSKRWLVNLGLAAFNVVVLRLSIGAAAWQAALWAQEQGIGLLNVVRLPSLFSMFCSLILLDLAIYAQHIAAHRWQWFWRLHQVHHSDPDFDTTTAIRFHPLEILLSMFYKVLLVLILGASPISVIIFEMILSSCALFNHGNISLPTNLERWVRAVLVTPNMHRIHHSAFQPETDSNYGFSLSCWDRLFKTYTHQAKQPLHIGLNTVEAQRAGRFSVLLSMPFQRISPR